MKKTKIDLEKYEAVENEDGSILLKPKKPKYPTNLEDIYRPYYIDNFNVKIKLLDLRCQIKAGFMTEERAEEVLALIQVLAYYDAWCKVDDYKPDFTDGKTKYCIENYRDKITHNVYCGAGKILAFKTSETRGLFLENFRELIEKCKNLL